MLHAMVSFHSLRKGLYIFSLLSLQHCTAPSTPPVAIDSPAKKTALIQSFNTTRHSYTQERLRPFSFSFVGNINQQEAIELFFQYDPKSPLLANNCQAIFGDYNLSKTTPNNQKLEGQCCFHNSNLLLNSSNQSSNSPLFQATFDSSFSSLTGNWKAIPQNITLYNKHKNIPQKTLDCFAQVLIEHFKKNNNAFMPKAGLDKKGIFLHHLKGHNLTIKHFSPIKLEWSIWEDVAEYSFDHHESIDLWFYNDDNDFVIIIHRLSWEEKLDENGNSIETESIHTETWKKEGEQLKNIFITNSDKKNTMPTTCYAIKKGEVLQLHNPSTGGLWEWQY